MNTIGLVNKIEDILYKKLPNFNIEADVRKWRLGGGEFIKIGISASTYEINGVAKQYPQYVTLMLDLKTLELKPFPFGGMGGGSIHLVPNSADPSEKYLAIKSIKVPFRKPQPNEKAVLSAIERFAENYLKLLQQYRDRLTQQAFVDYDKLLGPKMKKGGVMSKTKNKKTMAKGGSLRAIAKKYEKNEDENMHSENVVLLAKHFGTADELKEAKQILATHEKEGSLSTENGAKRRELSLKLIAKARTEMAKEGIKFSKGGKMAKGVSPKAIKELADAERILHYIIIDDRPARRKYSFVKETVNKFGDAEAKKIVTNIASRMTSYEFSTESIKKDRKLYDNLTSLQYQLKYLLSKNKMAKGGGVGRGKNQKVKDWYIKNYPNDELGEQLNDYPTFDSLWRYIAQGEDVYKILGVGDSLIRERVFEHLAKVNKVGYDYIYDKWLGRYAKGGLLGGFNYSIGGL